MPSTSRPRGRRAAIITALLVAGSLAAAPAEASRLTLTPTGCSGQPITPSRVINGTFDDALRGSYVMVPITVPPGTTQVRVKYCWRDPDGLTSTARSTLDLGLWQPAPGARPWGTPEFRGWGGSSHGDVAVSRQGFSSEAQYVADPNAYVPGRTTRGFVPGRIPAGRWAVELGVAYVTGPEDGNPTGRIPWRVEVELKRDPAFAAAPYRPARFDQRPARRAPGWYAGDLHVHAEHSSLGNATMREVFGYAFKPLAQGGAGLDFVSLTDYVTTSAWGEIGRLQPDYPGKQILRSAEVITYHGHFGNHASLRYVDHRTGPVYARAASGGLRLLRPATAPRSRFTEIHRAGGFVEVNHPRIFYPSTTPGFAAFCRGCPWEYSDAATDWNAVDAFEISTGPPNFGASPSPFLLQAISLYDSLTARGHHLAAVAVSDSHDAGRFDATSRPVGTGTTVVHAGTLSERGVVAAVRAGHTYAKPFGEGGPDLRLVARRRGRRVAIMGDTVRASSATLVARVLGGERPAAPSTAPRTLLVLRDGTPYRSVAVGPGTTRVALRVGPGAYRLQLARGDLVEGFSTPIWVGGR